MSGQPRLLAVAVCALLGSACTSPSAGQPASPARSTPSASLPTAVSDWPTYHRTPDRAGALASPTFRTAAVAWRSDQLDADIYASPIVAGGKVVAATEDNTLYAFDAATGRLLWNRHLGPPVDSSSLPCGNIGPVSGITGTPVADASAGVLYATAFIAPGHHQLFTVALADGTVRGQADADPPGEDPRTHQQRAALALGSGRVYVAYGGLFGDCGRYHGWIVGVPAAGSASVQSSYRVPSGQAAGLWAPSGPALDKAGNVYVASGNSFSAAGFDYGNSVIKLAPALAQDDWFAPAEWAALNRVDGDLGSMGPLLVADNLLFQAGKPGIGYLLQTSHLGGIGGQAFSAPVCSGGGGVFGGAAAAPPYLYVPCTSGIAALRVDLNGPSFSVAWRSSNSAAAPPIVAGGAVWSADTGAGVLYAVDAASGRPLAQIQVGEMMHFTTPAATGRLVLVGAGRRIVAVKLAA